MTTSNLIMDLTSRRLIHPPTWLPEQTQYLTIMGSFAYGVSSDTSDCDVYGWAIPDKVDVFPHLKGEIEGFGRQKQRFEVWQQHGIVDPTAMGGLGREYDFAVYNVVKYAQLCMENNPNMIDSLFVPVNCIIHMTPVGQVFRDRRKDFLHKGAWAKFKGYSYSQLAKARSKEFLQSPERRAEIEQYGYSTKFGYHIVRLLGEVEQLLVEGDIDLQRNREQLKSIRRGEWSLEQLERYFVDKERQLEQVYLDSQLPYKPDDGKIRGILLDVLEQHFGSLSGAVVRENQVVAALREIQRIAGSALTGR